MAAFPTQQEILHATLKGLCKARKNFSFWANEELNLHEAPYKFLSIHVAQELGTLKAAPEIFLDATVVDVLRSSLKERESYKEFINSRYLKQELIDLTLDVRQNSQELEEALSKVVMTVRNGVRSVKDEYKNDIDVLCKLMMQQSPEESSLEYGVFAFYLDVSTQARKKAARRVEEIVEAFDKVVNSYKNLRSSFQGGEIQTIENEGEWCVGVYVIEPTYTK